MADRQSRLWRRTRRVVAAGFTLTLLAWSVAWLAGARSWRLDLLANLSGQGGALALLWLAATLALRRWRCAAGATIAVLLFAAALLPHRAHRGGDANDPQAVRILSVNAHLQRGDAEQSMRTLLDSDADVLAIVETSWDLIRRINASEEFAARYPHRAPQRLRPGAPAILSRWPLEGRRITLPDAQPDDEIKPGMSPRGAIIRRPQGAFVLVATHPPSPRTELTWREGNLAMELLGDELRTALAPLGMPVIVAGDFNSTPAGSRSREFASRTGLNRAKPWWLPVGTWPNDALWPARLAIDDLFVPDNVRVRSWRTLARVEGGDHSPILVDLIVPPPLASAPSEAPGSGGQDEDGTG